MGYDVILVGQAYDLALRLRASTLKADRVSCALIRSECQFLARKGLPRRRTLGVYSRNEPSYQVVHIGEFLLYARRRRRNRIVIYKIRRRSPRARD